jgi:probable phosphoglycerate mutase
MPADSESEPSRIERPAAAAEPTVSTPLLLVRHGQSVWNAGRRWQGTADSPLTRLGREQAHGVAAGLATTGTRFSGPWSSDLGRASATAEILARVLGIGPVVTDRRLREARAGDWEGMTRDEIETAYPGWLAARRRPASFESVADVIARATDVLQSIARTTPAGTVALVVTHSGVIRSVIRHLGVADPRIPNLGGVWLAVDRSPDRAVDGSPIGEPFEGDGRGGLVLGDLYDPDRRFVSGVDAPGEDPGEQPDEPDADRPTEG